MRSKMLMFLAGSAIALATAALPVATASACPGGGKKPSACPGGDKTPKACPGGDKTPKLFDTAAF